MRARSLVIAVAAAAALGSGAVSAQQPGQPQPGMGPGQGMGPGMMGGMGPGMMGQGRGMGHGMMGRGMGMGPGMMGGGMGRGMGPGGGMMGGMGIGPLWQLDLTDTQRQEVLKLHDELRRKNWDLLGKQQDEQAKLRDAYLASGKRDRAAIVAAYKRISDLRLQRVENSLEAAEKMESVLTPQQREQLKRWGPWWMEDAPQ